MKLLIVTLFMITDLHLCIFLLKRKGKRKRDNVNEREKKKKRERGGGELFKFMLVNMENLPLYYCIKGFSEFLYSFLTGNLISPNQWSRYVCSHDKIDQINTCNPFLGCCWPFLCFFKYDS